MSVRLKLYTVVFLGALTLGSGCAKRGAPPSSGSNPAPLKSAPLVEPTEAAAVGNIPCESTLQADLDLVMRAENAKIALDSKAKNSPEKSNFKKLYEAESAFSALIDSKIAKFTECKPASEKLSELGSKLEKSKANLLYLRESFPDFK